MCNFFSFCTSGNGKPYYFNWKMRQRVLSGDLNLNPDSHASIADYFFDNPEDEDRLNK